MDRNCLRKVIHFRLIATPYEADSDTFLNGILAATSMARRQIAVTHNLNGKVMDLEDYDDFKGTLEGSPNLVIDFHAE